MSSLAEERINDSLKKDATVELIPILQEHEAKITGSYVLEKLINAPWKAADIDISVSDQYHKSLTKALKTRGYVRTIVDKGNNYGRGKRTKFHHPIGTLWKDLDVFSSFPVGDMSFLDNTYDGKKLTVGDWESVITRSCTYNPLRVSDPRAYSRIQKYMNRGFTIKHSIPAPPKVVANPH